MIEYKKSLSAGTLKLNIFKVVPTKEQHYSRLFNS